MECVNLRSRWLMVLNWRLYPGYAKDTDTANEVLYMQSEFLLDKDNNGNDNHSNDKRKKCFNNLEN